jgi:hypothetical protein
VEGWSSSRGREGIVAFIIRLLDEFCVTLVFPLGFLVYS